MAMLHRTLWAPWRLAYLQQLTAEQDAAGIPEPASGRCFLCEAGEVEAGSDAARERLVLTGDEYTVTLLNRYPYTNGHLLIAPRPHVATLGDLSPVQRAAMMEAAERAERLLRTAVNCQGLNIGINLGRCAGAGVPGHLHVHVLPRWEGDTNFMQTVGGIRVIPQALDQSYAHLAQVLQDLPSRPDDHAADRASR